jgi:hypothetical protein
MGRRARVNFRARILLAGLQMRIRSQPVHNLPSHLFVAWEILSSELGLPDIKARTIISKSVSAAQRCVTAQNELISDIARIRTRRRLKTACRRIPQCIKRGPAALRKNLSQAVLPLLEETIDLEVIESVFETARKTFEAFPDNEPSCAALNSMKGVHFCGLPTTAQNKVRMAIAGLKAAKNANRTAVQLFIAIGAALKSENAGKTSTQTGNLMVRYVAELAAIWRWAGPKAKPSRARRYLDLNPTIYSSRFHQFSELILLAITGHRAGSHGIRPWIEASRKGEKYKWRVSDNHLKRALGH